MNSFLRFCLVFAAFAPAVDGAAFTSATVVCLEDSDICAGNAVFTSPSPGEVCEGSDDVTNCTIIYSGGWSWEYRFIEGYDEGTDLTLEDPDDVAAAETGLVVLVTLDDDEICEINVGNETCAECSTSECSGFNVTYDCTNVDMGAMSMDCVALEPIFYPLEMSNGTGTDDEMGGGGDTGSGGSGGGDTGSASSCVASAKVLLTAFVAGAAFFAI
jgi:hypothetical protein